MHNNIAGESTHLDFIPSSENIQDVINNDKVHDTCIETIGNSEKLPLINFYTRKDEELDHTLQPDISRDLLSKNFELENKMLNKTPAAVISSHNDATDENTIIDYHASDV